MESIERGKRPRHRDSNQPERGTSAGTRVEPDHIDEPSSVYLSLIGLFVGATSLGLVWLHRGKRDLPPPTLLDVALLSMGTARLSRLITRDKVMRPLRAPFTVIAAGKEHERAEGSDFARAAGELLTCPRCTAIWAASGLTVAYYGFPTFGRFASLVLSSALTSDFANRVLALLNELQPREPVTPRAAP